MLALVGAALRTALALMGASRPYSVFAGSLECLAGVLLLWRRTTTLGALVGVMANVLMLNLCDDVPVKLYATHLIVFGLALAGPDLGRLAAVLVWNRPTTPRPPRRPLARPWMERARLAAKGLVIAVGEYLMIDAVGRVRVVPVAIRPYDAAFTVESFRRAQETTPPSTYVLQARWADADRVVLVGVLDGVATEIHLRRKAWLLRTRGFHWVSPVPYNR